MKCKKISDAKWRSENSEIRKKVDAEWVKNNPDKVRATKKRWVKNNPEKKRRASKNWYKKNPELIRFYGHNYRVKKKGLGKLTKEIAKKLYFLQKGKCACCGKSLGKNFHLDHIMPIALEGANEDWNMQLLTQRCNQQKSAKHPIDFMQSRGFLL